MKDSKKIIKNYLDKENKLKGWPSKKKNQWIVLDYLASKFKLGIEYSESEINDILKEHHTFNDHCLLRRELFNNGFIDRSPDCSNYWKVAKVVEIYGETEELIIKDANSPNTYVALKRELE